MATTPERSRRGAAGALLAAGLVAGLLLSSDSDATPAPFTFMAPNPGWIVATNGGQPLTDPEGDTPGPRDVVGDAANPMLFIASDATHLYFRLRVDSDPLQNPTNFTPFGWGCFVNTDSNLQTYEFSAHINGVSNPDQLNFYKNTLTASPNDPNEAPDMPPLETVPGPLAPAIGHAQVVPAPSMFGGNPDFFIQWAVELSTALANGFNPSQPANYYCGSSNNGTNIDADCSGAASGGCPLDAEFSDPIACGPLGCSLCGDGMVTAAEGCDDGNSVSGDGCNSACLKELGQPCTGGAACASGFCDPTGNLCACDQDADCPAGQTCNTAVNPNVCVAPGCGNNVVDPGEGCDDGNTTNGDGCTSACLKELGEPCTGNGVCASGFCDPAGNVCACDQSGDCSGGQLCNTAADPNTCVDPGCGNSVLEVTEGCDDGNTTNGDGCNSACLREIGQICTLGGQCASAFCDPADGTCACDDDGDCPTGSQCNTTLDPNECVPAGCGNGVVEPTEGCDDGNSTSGDGCNSQCLLELGQTCTGNAACASGLCDPAGNVCACDQDIDCPGAQVCDTTPDPNACADSICGNGAIEGMEGCDDQNTAPGDGCSPTCAVEESWVCQGEPSACDLAPCSGDADCAFCNEQYGICVPGCQLPSDCPVGLFCDTTSAICVPLCLVGAECPSGHCNAATGQCVECEIDADCPNGEECQGGTCGPVCTQDADCPNGLLCDPVQAICVECLVTADCAGGLTCVDLHCLPGCNEELDCGGICNETIGVCVECTEDADCPNGEACDEAFGQCITVTTGCVMDSDCPGQVCDEPTGECVECTQDPECPNGEVCDEATNTCVGCVQDSDCPDGTVCDEPAQECVECTQDSECPSGQVCDEPASTCVGCVEDADCPDGLVCEESTNTCIGCTQDPDCPSGTVCDEPAQACVECTQDSECPTGEVCNETSKTCVECTQDSECPIGNTCDMTTGQCITLGCTQDPDCPSGSFCDEGPGQCVECTQDSECAGGEVCDETAKECVECTQDSECGSGTCDPETRTCSEPPPAGVVAEGSGLFCATRQQDTGDGKLALTLLGLLGLTLARRRRR